MPSKKAVLRIKGFGAIALAIGLAALSVPSVVDFNIRDQADQGSRPLVVIATSGGDKALTLHVANTIDTDGDSTFTFSVERADAVEADERAWVAYEVSVIGSGLDDAVTCGDSATPLRASATASLSAGPLYTFEVDQLPGRASATNFGLPTDAEPDAGGSAVPSVAPEPDPVSGDESPISAYRSTGNLATYNGGEARATSYQEETSGYGVWVGQCTVKARAVWGTYDDETPTMSAQATLLAPQFNFTSIDAETDYQTAMDVALNVERADGAVLTESYPAVQATDSMWTGDYAVTWQGTIGTSANYAFTSQPTLLFVNRDRARQEQFWQLLAGLALGLAITLIVRGTSDLLDLSVRDA